MKNLAQRSFQISQDYFPETYVCLFYNLSFFYECNSTRMGRLAIVNAPSTFAVIWSFIRPWLAKETANKVFVLGSDYRRELLEMIDEENLPSTLGGKCYCKTEGDDSGGPRCHLSASGPWLDGRVGWGPHAENVATDTNGDPEKSDAMNTVVLDSSVNDAANTIEEH
jgi:hypothetical protein